MMMVLLVKKNKTIKINFPIVKQSSIIIRNGILLIQDLLSLLRKKMKSNSSLFITYFSFINTAWVMTEWLLVLPSII